MAKKIDGKGKKSKVSATTSERPSLEQLQEEIRIKAHEFYSKRVTSGEPGDDLSDWLQSEVEIKQKYNL